VSKDEVWLRVGRSAFARMHIIHSIIRTGQYPNVKKLANRLEVSKRAIERDIEKMRDMMGAPIAYCYNRRGYFYEDDTYSVPPIRLTDGEMMAVFLGEKLLAQYKGHPYEEEIKSAYAKIQALFPESAAIDYGEIERTVSFAVEDVRGDEQLLLRYYQILKEAISVSKTVWADYYTANRDSREMRDIDPYHLRFQDGAWYCIGYCHKRQEMRMFALDRFFDLRLTERSFKRNEDFTVDEYLGNSFKLELGKEPQEVRIFFNSYAARWVRERNWHESQSLEKQPDGSIILRMSVSGLGEVKRWVLSFGGHAEVLAPAKLREEVKKEILAMAGSYR
jgi:predicted DNA-binding transcriptional regulator YafY